MEREQIFDAVAAERRRIADLLDSLDEDSLATWCTVAISEFPWAFLFVPMTCTRVGRWTS
jgi:hypothetical protein